MLCVYAHASLSSPVIALGHSHRSGMTGMKCLITSAVMCLVHLSGLREPAKLSMQCTFVPECFPQPLITSYSGMNVVYTADAGRGKVVLPPGVSTEDDSSVRHE